jgi:hypothetical protein
MNTRYFVPVIGTLLAALPAPVSAQGKLYLEISGGRTFLSEDRKTLFRWDDGWTLGLGAAYEILPGLAITGSESYSNFLFRQPPSFVAIERISSASGRNLLPQL